MVGHLVAAVLSVGLPGMCLGSALGAPAAGAAERTAAQQILRETGVRGGLVVHVGCGDGRLTAALHAGDSFLVHGLDADAENVERARAHVRSLGLYGKVSAERFDGKRLPYADNLVNLLVAEDLGGVAMDEVMRALAPGGVACIRKAAAWSKTVKPRPGNTDEWTHYLHDASGNAVAHDEVVGPPRRVQWIARPRHTRGHEHIPSLYALVSTGGRIFYIADEGAIEAVRRPPQWRLVARDAYNGILLWKRPVAAWFPHIVNWGQTPSHLQRRLVAVGDRVYVTLGLHAPLSAVDAATGETLKVYDETRGTEEVLCHKGILLLAVRSVTDERTAELEKWAGLVKAEKSPVYVRETAEPLVKRLRAVESGGERAVLALDAGTGRLLWKKAGDDVAGLRPDTLSAIGDRVFYQRGRDVVCLDLKAGREVWAAPSPPLRVVYAGRVVCSDAKTVTALSAESGKTLWTQPGTLSQVRDAFVAGGSLWLGGFKPCEGKRGPSWGPYFATQRDLATGKMLRHIEPEGPGHHHRCWRNKATDRYILGGRRGVEFIDLASGDVLWHSWVRGVCRYGVMPSNGLLYAPPHACACYIAAKLTGFYALAPASAGASPAEAASAGASPPKAASAPLEKGPAFADISNPKSQISNLKSQIADPKSQISDPKSDISKADWPTYRHDAGRSGATPCAVPAVLGRRWQADVGGSLTSPTVSGGKVFVASVDEHRVWAIDADSGRPAWHFTAGARVDSPPALHNGRAIFGCRDGYVYSLRAWDGALAWRLRAARSDRRVTACGQLESPSPVHGSVLVHDGAAYFTAGRSSYLDGGIDLYRLQPETGKVLSRTPIYSPDPETGRQPPQEGPCYMPGALSDILSSDGPCVYLRDTVFDSGGRLREKGGPHLFTLTGFLDDTWPHRSYWIFGTRCSISSGCSGRDRNLVSGRLLVFDETAIYGYGRAQIHWSNQLQDGPYRLFALKRGEGQQQWAKPAAIQVRAMVLADKVLFVAGPPAGDGAEAPGPDRAALLLAISVDSAPVFDGLAAAGGRLYLATVDGQVACYGPGK
ncbi:MAG: hypothetical protein AMS14_11240 [Planctomycetes bacterium DG_20]|nr:MAG: hypothetical protein AMS14_11240 [Planctomycetes bacterium DG_20]